jgi:hypothetical protein
VSVGRNAEHDPQKHVLLVGDGRRLAAGADLGRAAALVRLFALYAINDGSDSIKDEYGVPLFKNGADTFDMNQIDAMINAS